MTLHASWVTAIIATPLLATMCLLLVAWVVRLPLRTEAAIARGMATAFTVSHVLSLGLLFELWLNPSDRHVTQLPAWFQVGSYHFELQLVADRLSLSFCSFASALLAIVAVFSRNYLHREPGFVRFFALLGLFGSGVLQVVLAGSLDFAFIGWELVGISSALLIAFFHERSAPVRHGLRAFMVYRLCDVGFLSAAVLLHHHAPSLTASAPPAPWWSLPVPANPSIAALVGLCLLWASTGKAAQFPLGGWLPRAMEGPTPSSAIFYGGISVHLGPYLLLRACSLTASSPWVSWSVVAVGVVTAVHATLVGRVQTDIKSRLAYAVMTQVGLIYVEIGLGLNLLAVVHIIGHASLRCLQLLRSPNVLADHLERARRPGAAQRLPRASQGSLVPASIRRLAYRGALERGHLDALAHLALAHAVKVLCAADRLERRWSDQMCRPAGDIAGRSSMLRRAGDKS